MTDSVSQADCGSSGSDNCLIASPDFNTTYLNNGSTLKEEIILQNELDRYEPLNVAQFIGSHNSAISEHYTSNRGELNLSHSDPDNYMTLTDQLNMGLRQLELDISWYNNQLVICHNHVTLALSDILCEGNSSLQSALSEIKSWIEKNNNAVIILYLDVNLPITNHIPELDNDLSQLQSYLLLPSLDQNNALPASDLTKDSLINKNKKNIIVENDDDIENTKLSQYVFTSVKNSKATPLPEQGIDTFFNSHYSCVDNTKYETINHQYHDDHYNLFRLNADRTVINYISSIAKRNPGDYIDYFTYKNIPMILKCPFNILSSSMLGFTCGSNSCSEHPTDPRLMSFIWSWEIGYPLKSNSADIAYINSETRHFENNTLKENTYYYVLCYHPTNKQFRPHFISWYIEKMALYQHEKVAALANQACEKSNGKFAVPTTSYWMSDALNIMPKTNENYLTLVNYQKVNDEWVPNDKKGL